MANKHHGRATKSVKPLGSKSLSQTLHVSPQKDNMAANVGGSSAHLLPSSKAMGHQDIKESGGKAKK